MPLALAILAGCAPPPAVTVTREPDPCVAAGTCRSALPAARVAVRRRASVEIVMSGSGDARGARCRSVNPAEVRVASRRGRHVVVELVLVPVVPDEGPLCRNLPLHEGRLTLGPLDPGDWIVTATGRGWIAEVRPVP